jgi:hypothetical protein
MKTLAKNEISSPKPRDSSSSQGHIFSFYSGYGLVSGLNGNNYINLSLANVRVWKGLSSASALKSIETLREIELLYDIRDRFDENQF